MLERFRSAVMAGINSWRGYDEPETPQSLADQYHQYWALYTGEAFNAAWRRHGVFKDQKVYRNTRLLFKHVSAIGDFYGSTVYQGSLATDGKRLPDGSRGAIPLDPQTGKPGTDDALLAAVAEWWGRTNWQQGMGLRPRYCSILGDALTELIDDPARHAVWPQLTWPGYVVDLQLDAVANVKRYAVEYPITIVSPNGQSQSGLYRKEVDKEAFRFFFQDRPWTDTRPGGHGEAEQENPYRFVPAVWDRHKVVWGDRGLSAIASTRQALAELNSVLSHGMDYQRKAFAAPVIIRGSVNGAARQVVGPDATSDPSKLAETLGFKEVDKDGGIEQLSFDIGKTLEILEFVKRGILEENPEASFYHELRSMSQLTGPAVERALGDAVSRVNMARAGYDAQSVKLFQMAVAMSGYRLNSGAWAGPTTRDQVFAPFNLESYAAGQLDMAILPRPVVPPTEEERIRLVQMKETIQGASSLVELGYEQTRAEQIIAEREATALRRVDVY
jgi:hypothetical protein